MRKFFTKKLAAVTLALLFAPLLHAQFYFISFSGSGQSTTVETVEVKNIDQGTTLVLDGTDVLNLVGTLGLNTQSLNQQGISVYPNPTKHTTQVEFLNTRTGQVSIGLYELNGQNLIQKHMHLSEGMHSFVIEGMGTGVHLIKINTPEKIYTQRLVSYAAQNGTASIRHTGSTSGTDNYAQFKQTSEVIEMQYNDGERLELKGISDDYAHIITMVPTESSTVDFEFIDCIDGDGNHYSVVTIGEQIWMAENLRTKKFNDGDDILGPFNGDDWVTHSTNAKLPAYTIYDHTHSAAEGLESPEEVVAAYGKMYNWHAVGTGNLCPAGWVVPDTADWNQMVNFIIDDNDLFAVDNVAAAFKSCRQINSPLGGDCATEVHPRWREDEDVYATNHYALSLVAAGYILSSSGNSSWLAARGYWWTSTPVADNEDNAIFRRFNHTDNEVSTGSFNKGVGQPIRCIKAD